MKLPHCLHIKLCKAPRANSSLRHLRKEHAGAAKPRRKTHAITSADNLMKSTSDDIG